MLNLGGWFDSNKWHYAYSVYRLILESILCYTYIIQGSFWIRQAVKLLNLTPSGDVIAKIKYNCKYFCSCSCSCLSFWLSSYSSKNTKSRKDELIFVSAVTIISYKNSAIAKRSSRTFS